MFEDKQAQTLASTQWAIGVNQLADREMWKEKDKKEDGAIRTFTGTCPSLHRKVIKVQVAVEAEWKKVFDLLMNCEEMSKWNKTVDHCATVAHLPAPENEPDKTSFIIYTRSRDNSIKIAAKRDFCTCYQQQVRKDGATWIGTACESSLCPKFAKYVRGETVIMAVDIKSTGAKSCLVTQIGSFNVKVNVIPSMVDTGVMKSFVQFGECLRKQAVI